jgi:hypothetical protein
MRQKEGEIQARLIFGDLIKQKLLRTGLFAMKSPVM